MVEAETERFTVGVFQDLEWAHKGVDALKQAGFPVESLTGEGAGEQDGARLSAV